MSLRGIKQSQSKISLKHKYIIVKYFKISFYNFKHLKEKIDCAFTKYELIIVSQLIYLIILKYKNYFSQNLTKAYSKYHIEIQL